MNLYIETSYNQNYQNKRKKLNSLKQKSYRSQSLRAGKMQKQLSI